jgi:hypothetical protein
MKNIKIKFDDLLPGDIIYLEWPIIDEKLAAENYNTFVVTDLPSPHRRCVKGFWGSNRSVGELSDYFFDVECESSVDATITRVGAKSDVYVKHLQNISKRR